MTDGKRWATDWLFKRTLQDLDSLLDLMFGEEGYEKLKKARQLVINEERKFSNGATPKMDVQLPGPVFDRYYREPDDDDDTSPAIPTPTAEGPVSKGALEFKMPDTPIYSKELLAKVAKLFKPREREIPIPPTTSESSFGEWMTPEDEAAYTNLQKDDIVERQSRIAREGSVKYAPALAELAKPAPDFTGRWNTREGGIADVGAQNRDDWNEEGRHRHDTNLDLMERLRDGGNRSF